MIIQNVTRDYQTAYNSMNKLLQDLNYLATEVDPSVFQTGQIQKAQQSFAAADTEIKAIAQYVAGLKAEYNQEVQQVQQAPTTVPPATQAPVTQTAPVTNATPITPATTPVTPQVNNLGNFTPIKPI